MMKLVDSWQSAWRWATMQIGAVAVIFGLLDLETQRAMLEAIGIPGERITAVLGGLVMIGRLVQFRRPGDEQ